MVAGLFLFALHSVSASPPTMEFAKWQESDPQMPAQVQRFESFLRDSGVAGILPTDQLLLNASDWRACKADAPYSMPPPSLWGHVVATLKFVRDVIVPALGPVTAVSGYRDPKLNKCAHGAPMSAHAGYYALDLLPAEGMTRADLILAACKLHQERGRASHIGLGFYDGLRFHIDSKGFRRWGSDFHAKTSPCVVASEK